MKRINIPGISALFRLLPFLVMVFSLFVSFAVWWILDTGFNLEARREFEEKSSGITVLINEMVRDNEHALRDGVGLFDVVGDVSEAQWLRFIHAQQTALIQKGIKYVGYVSLLNSTDNSSVFPKALPAVTSAFPKEQRLVCTYLTRLDQSEKLKNLPSLFDICADQSCRLAMEQARTQGNAVIASRIFPALNPGAAYQSELVLFLPVYRQGATSTSGAPHPALVKGFMFCRFDLRHLMRRASGVLSREIAYEIFDVTSGKNDNLIFSSLIDERISLPSAYRPDLTTVQTVEVMGRNWKIFCMNLPLFRREFHYTASKTGLIAGIALSLLLSAIIYKQQRTRDQALKLAMGMTQELRSSEETVRLILDTTGVSIYGIDLNGCCTFCNMAGLKLLGYSGDDQLKGLNMHDLIHHSHPDGSIYPWKECPVFAALNSNVKLHVMDTVFWKNDGTCFPVVCWYRPRRENGEITGAVVSFMDMTEHKKSALAFQKQAVLLQQEIDARREVQGLLLDQQLLLQRLNEELELRVNEEVENTFYQSAL